MLRCPTFAQNLILLECPPYPGWSCDFECKVGYRRKSKTLVTCESTGKWSPPTESLCEGNSVILTIMKIYVNCLYKKNIFGISPPMIKAQVSYFDNIFPRLSVFYSMLSLCVTLLKKATIDKDIKHKNAESTEPIQNCEYLILNIIIFKNMNIFMK